MKLRTSRLLRLPHRIGSIKNWCAAVTNADCTILPVPCSNAHVVYLHRRKLNRRFIVVEGIYANTGDVAPLAAIAALKWK